MKFPHYVLSIVTVIVFAFCIAFITGCDDDDDDNTLSVSPSSIRLPAGTATNISLTAGGGSGGYSWIVSDEDLGSVVGADETAIYSSSTATGMNFITVSDSLSNSVTSTVTQE